MSRSTIPVIVKGTKVRFYSTELDATYHVGSLTHLTGRPHVVATVAGRGAIPDGFLVLEPGSDPSLYDSDGELPEDTTALLLPYCKIPEVT